MPNGANSSWPVSKRSGIGPEKRPERGARQGAADADPPDADRRQIRLAQLDALQSHHHVDRPIHRTDHAREMRGGGTFSFAEDAVSYPELSAMFPDR